MEIKILCPRWGQEHLGIQAFTSRIKEAGYDGIETWLPEEASARKELFDALQQKELHLVSHQHQAHGAHFSDFKDSFLHYLRLSAEGGPVLINSHTGKDYFTLAQHLELIDIAAEFSAAGNIPVVHETHRGRMGFCPTAAKELFDARPGLTVTADLSHWVCVTESFLENFAGILEETIARTRHIHARIGFEEGPQVSDPRAPEWQPATELFFIWWDRMAESRRQAGAPLLTFTTEFGPPPYLPTLPYTNKPVADQFAINCYMKDRLQQRYHTAGNT